MKIASTASAQTPGSKYIVLAMPCASSAALDHLLDGAEDRMAGFVLHFDADAIAKRHERRLRRAVQQGFDRAHFDDAAVSGAAVGHRLAGPAVEFVRDSARADDGAGGERPGPC